MARIPRICARNGSRISHGRDGGLHVESVLRELAGGFGMISNRDWCAAFALALFLVALDAWLDILATLAASPPV